MSDFNINYLLKDELKYELLARGQEPAEDNVISIRKQLRACVGLEPQLANLHLKLKLAEELKLVQTKLGVIQLKLEDAKDEASTLQIVQFQAKIQHVKMRVKVLNHAKLEEKEKLFVEQLTRQCDECEKLFSEIKDKANKTELNELEESMNKSFVQEECELGSKPSPFHPTQLINTSTPTRAVSSEANIEPKFELKSQQTSLKTDSIFNKISNPIEMYLNRFTVTNGLEVGKLLNFIRNLTELRKHTSLTEKQIFEIIPNYSAPPLLNHILEARSSQRSLDELHSSLLNDYVPLTMREKLKQDLIYRPQKINEPLALYINEIRCNHEILKTNLSENELVNFIKLGINPEIRNKLIFESNPTSFKDLERICINVNNVIYNDQVRYDTNLGSNSSGMHFRHAERKPFPQNHGIVRSNISRNREDKRCYNCNKIGHLARDCYKNRNSKNS